jgi:hypothetical protein
MNRPSWDIKDMLEAESSIGLIFGKGGNLFLNAEPTTPDNCVAIFDGYGSPPQLTMNPEERYEYPSVQIRIRNKKQDDAWVIIEGIMVALHGRNHETWNGTLYTVIKAASSPALLDWDDNGRCRFVINFNLQRR